MKMIDLINENRMLKEELVAAEERVKELESIYNSILVGGPRVEIDRLRGLLEEAEHRANEDYADRVRHAKAMSISHLAASRLEKENKSLRAEVEVERKAAEASKQSADESCAEVERLRKDIGFLLSIVPDWAKFSAPGLGPTMYGTGTFDGDIKVIERVQKIEALAGEGK